MLLVSCASSDRGAVDQQALAHLNEVLGYIRVEHIAPPGEDTRQACPPQIHTYEKESDDTELRAALNMFGKSRTMRADGERMRLADA